jgi:hypothetical protein
VDEEQCRRAAGVGQREHNLTTLLGENGKLEKTRVGDYGLTYDGKSVASLGFGMASAQKLNDKKLTTCPQSAICEALCLGETSGQNLLYGGEGKFRSGPRLSQYLKTEAFVLNPEQTAIILAKEIDAFVKKGKKEDFQPAIRLNVTSDFPPKVFEALIRAFPDVQFYDYTKLDSNPIAPNHHLTYSSTGASQVVNGKKVENPFTNWDRMVRRLDGGFNVAMAFSSKDAMPKFIVDEKTGNKYQVWNGDNYDARFLDPKPGQEGNLLNKGMIVGLTNKDRTTKPELAAEKNNGFFLDYDPKRDGDTLVIRDQESLARGGPKVIKLAPRPAQQPAQTPPEGGVSVSEPLSFSRNRDVPVLREDIPNERWLNEQVEDAIAKGRDRYGAPAFRKSTGSYGEQNVRVPVSVLAKLPGMRGEQQNVRAKDLESLKQVMQETGKLPLLDNGKEYAPFVMVAYNGEAWVNEGNHRIMAANALGWKDLPVEVRYFDGGQRADGPMSPDNIRKYAADEPTISFSRDRSPIGFYSALADSVGKLTTASAPVQGWKDAIKGMVNKGQVKQDEVEWSGITDWLDLQQGKVTKDQVQQYLNSNGVQVEEVVLGGRGQSQYEIIMADEQEDGWNLYEPTYDSGNFVGNFPTYEEAEEAAIERNGREAPKYGEYTLPGGENYREVQLTLPEKRLTSLPEGYEVQQFKDEPFARAKSGFRVIDPTGVAVDYNPRRTDGRYDTEREAIAGALKALSKGSYRDVRGSYRSRHWSVLNPLAHIRMNDRTDADGKRVLFVEEVQSDWGQEGKKIGFSMTPAELAAERKRLEDAHNAYVGQETSDLNAEFRELSAKLRDLPLSETQEGERLRARQDSILRQLRILSESEPGQPENKGVPRAPFVTKTEGWLNLALKRIVTMAAGEGYDRVAFINGEQSADRYDLSKQVEELMIEREGDYFAIAMKPIGQGYGAGRRWYGKAQDLPDVAGKELADKIAAQPEGRSYMRGLDLKVGGEGMKTFYDQIVPAALKKLLPKVGGGQVVTVEMERGKPSRAPSEATPFLDWMAANHPDVKRVDAARAWSMGVENNSYVQEFYETIRSMRQPGFDVTDAMREKAEEGLPMFSRNRDPHSEAGKKKLTEGPSWMQGLPEDVQESLRKVGAVPAKLSIKDRFDALRENFASKLIQGVFDPYAPLQKLDDTAYMQARMANNVTGAFDHLVTNGQVKWDGDWISPVKGTKGLYDIFRQLPEGEVDRFLWWIAANRADRLSKEEREFLFSGRDVAALKRLNQPGMGTKVANRPVLYAKVLTQLNQLNRSVLDLAKQSGLINQEQYVRYANDAFYIPFYRLMEDGDLSGPATAAGLVGQKFSEKLKGSERQLNDLLANYMNNWDHILTASAKNMAGKNALEAAEAAGVAKEIKFWDDKTKGTVKVMVDGKEKRYIVDDPMVMDAISSIYTPALSGFLVKTGSSFKRVFTRFVTASPTFKFYNNLIRDAITSQALSPELSNNPVLNTYRGFKLMGKGNPMYDSMLVGGGIFKFATWDEGDRHQYVKRLVDNGVDSKTILNTPEKIKAFLEGAFAKYMEVGDRAENAQRAAIYDAAIKAGKSQLEASFAARQIIDFSLTGKWAAIRYLTAVVPFFGARLQGMYSLGKLGIAPTLLAAQKKEMSATERARAIRFTGVTFAVTLATIAKYLMNMDDEDFKRREDWDRDSFWWIKIDGVAWRIPKPFEIGAFATIVERGLEQIVDSSVEGKVFGKRLWAVVMDQLSMNPMPQILRPAFDLYANKDGFRETDIESPAMRRLPIEDRVGQNTSYAARAMGAVSKEFADVLEVMIGKETADKFQFSPVQIDYLVKGYLGWVGTQALVLSDAAVRGLSGIEDPTPRFQERLPVKLTLGNTFQELPTSSSRYVGDFYRQAREINEVMSAIREYERARDFDKARELMEEKRDKVELSGLYNRTQRQLSAINKELRQVRDDKEMSADEKRARIDQLERIREEYAKSAEDTRKDRR